VAGNLRTRHQQCLVRASFFVVEQKLMKLTGKTENKTTIFEKIKQIDKMI
jgi:hypothetical protein